MGNVTQTWALPRLLSMPNVSMHIFVWPITLKRIQNKNCANDTSDGLGLIMPPIFYSM